MPPNTINQILELYTQECFDPATGQWSPLKLETDQLIYRDIVTVKNKIISNNQTHFKKRNSPLKYFSLDMLFFSKNV